MEEKVIRLPDADEMLQRLVSVMDEPHARQKFYPILLRRAGEELYPEGVVMLLMLAIHDYTEGLPPAIGITLSMRIPEYIDALITDPEAAADAKAFNERAMKS